MNVRLFGLALLPLWTISSLAGPCTRQIHDAQLRIDVELNETAAAGPAGTEGTSALLGHQPTPASLAAAETKLGDVSSTIVDKVRKDISVARRADLAGNKRRCMQALANAKRLIEP